MTLERKDFGDTKVGQIGIALLIQQQVVRLDVPVDHAAAVGDVQRSGHLIKQIGGGTQRETGSAEPAAAASPAASA